MRYRNYNTSRRHHNRTTRRRNRDPQPRCSPHVPPAPPLPLQLQLSSLRRIQANIDDLLSEILITGQIWLPIRCAYCGGSLTSFLDDDVRRQTQCPCICHQDNTSQFSPRDANGGFETTTAASDDDDQVITREIIREYLHPRNYSVIMSGNKEEEEGGGGEICVVCFSEMKNKEVFKRLDCGHNYHEECITKWLLLKNSCPMCVSVVIHPNFSTLGGGNGGRFQF